jgi:flagellar biosynthesis anti-sigma factor FlgM
VSSKISPVDSSGPATAAATGGVGQRPANMSNGPAQAPLSPDSVQITETANQLAVLEQAVSDLPAVNESRVSTTRNAIEQGTYTVVPKQIANKLLQFEQLLPDPSEE